jgi:hypothetical protein
LQLNYEATFSTMLGFFALESCADSLRVILAFRDSHDASDCVVTSRSLRSQLKNKTMILQPTNVYEDIGRDTTVVTMVFITQCLLIGFVVSGFLKRIPTFLRMSKFVAHTFFLFDRFPTFLIRTHTRAMMARPVVP